jgi:hypothetical protein
LHKELEYPFQVFIKNVLERLRTEVEIQGNKMISAFDGNQGLEHRNTLDRVFRSPGNDCRRGKKGMKNQADPEGANFTTGRGKAT